jgi:tRNA threonylcarbamoyladenosine biosynthesis protein TsaB
MSAAPERRWLAFDTSTDVLSLGLACGDQVWTQNLPGGAQASSTLIPVALAMLAEAQMPLASLDAIVFGRGPGAFTGLRTACSVAQGLAFGADLSVLPIDTLLAVAEEAREANASIGAAPVTRVLAVMDARMEQVYAAAYEFTPHAVDVAGEANQRQGTWRCVQEPELHSPEALRWPADWSQDSFIAAGNAWPVYAGRWPTALTAPQVMALPTAAALLRLAPAAWAAGEAVPPEEALPLYIRDKVAQTTDERMLIKSQQAEQAAQIAQVNQASKTGSPTITP